MPGPTIIMRNNRTGVEDLGMKSGMIVYGHFWFSKKQQAVEFDKGKTARKFALLTTGEVVEYTEMVRVEDKIDDPEAGCWFDDAVYLGTGRFWGWK